MLLTVEKVSKAKCGNEKQVSNEVQPTAWKYFSDSEHSERLKLYWQEKYWLLLYVRNERWTRDWKWWLYFDQGTN